MTNPGGSSPARGIPQRIKAKASTGVVTRPTMFNVLLAESIALSVPIQRVMRKPSPMPSGQPMIVRAVLVSEYLTSLIRLRAATKLIGIARNVPKVVANNARNTVSMILSHVIMAVAVSFGAPIGTRAVARRYCASATGWRVGMRTLS